MAAAKGKAAVPPVQEAEPGKNMEPEPRNGIQGSRDEKESTALFRITCRNKISETIGGVEFLDGVGYTKDAYSASWFANKDGYAVITDDGKQGQEP